MKSLHEIIETNRKYDPIFLFEQEVDRESDYAEGLKQLLKVASHILPEGESISLHVDGNKDFHYFGNSHLVVLGKKAPLTFYGLTLVDRFIAEHKEELHDIYAGLHDFLKERVR